MATPPAPQTLVGAPTTSNLPIMDMSAPFDTTMPFNIIIWGKPGCGKTMLASTGRGRKLFLMFDPTGHASLAGRPDTFVYDLTGRDHYVCNDMLNDNPLRLHQYLVANNIRTLVFDSITTYYWLALQNVVAKLRTPRNNISIETPSQAGYAQRNSIMHQTFTSIFSLTTKLRMDTILILHEGTPHTVQRQVAGAPPGTMEEVQGDITPSITMSALNLLGIRVSEIWHMTQLDHGPRRVEVRPCRGYTPMKTRIFKTGPTASEFTVPFNADTGEGAGLSTWIDAWVVGGGQRMPLPRS